MDRLLRALPLPSGGHHFSLSFLALHAKLFPRWLAPRSLIASLADNRSSTGSPELSDRNSDCAICLCEMEPGEARRELECRHLFHELCISKWFEHPRRSCPVCRAPPAAPAAPAAPAGEPSKSGRGSEIQDGTVFVLFPWEDSGGDAWWIR